MHARGPGRAEYDTLMDAADASLEFERPQGEDKKQRARMHQRRLAVRRFLRHALEQSIVRPDAQTLEHRILDAARTGSYVRHPVHVWFETLSVQCSPCPGLHISQLFQSSKRGHLSQRPCHTLILLCPESLGLRNCHSLVSVPSPHCHSHLPPTLPKTQWRAGFGLP